MHAHGNNWSVPDCGYNLLMSRFLIEIRTATRLQRFHAAFYTTPQIGHGPSGSMRLVASCNQPCGWLLHSALLARKENLSADLSLALENERVVFIHAHTL